MVVIFGNIVSRKPRIRPEFDDAARHFVDSGVLGAVFIEQRRIDFGGQQQPIGLDAGIVNSVQGMESHIQNIFEFLRIEDDVIHLCTVGGSERQGITLENEELTVSSGRGKPINNASLLYIHTHGIRRKSMREEMQGYMDQGMEYSLAYQLYVQTHGSPLWHAPPRPVIEPAIAKHHREIAEEYAKAVKAAMTGDGARADAFIKRTGLLAQNICRQWFTDAENGWPPNSPITIDKKTKGKGGKTNPLIDTGALRKAIVYVVRSD